MALTTPFANEIESVWTGSASHMAPYCMASTPVTSTATKEAQSDQPGQMFANLLFTAALTCHAPIALIAIAESDGRWTTMSYGIGSGDIRPDNHLFRTVAEAAGPLEIVDLIVDHQIEDVGPSRGGVGVRYVYGIPLHAQGSAQLGILCVLDDHHRQLSTREHRGLVIVADKIAERLALRRRVGSSSQAGAFRTGLAKPRNRADFPRLCRAVTGAHEMAPVLLTEREAIRPLPHAHAPRPATAAASSVALAEIVAARRQTPNAIGFDLTQRQHEILTLVAAGHTNKAIASELYLSHNTVRNYVQGVLTKLGAHSKLEAVLIAAREGIIVYPPHT